MNIGFIGVGIMGKSMVRNLLKAGHSLYIYSRSKDKVTDVLAEGAIWQDSVKECAANSQIIMSIVGYPSDVEEIYFGADGIIENAAKGSYLIDLTTSSPALAIKIADQAKQKNLKALDAPVTGGDIGAKNGTLSILVGGEQADFDYCRPIFEAIGQNISYMGANGSGQHAKMCNQIVIAGTISGICEALAYAQAHDIDFELLYQAIAGGAAGGNQMNYIIPKILADDYQPGFFIKHIIKDLTIAKEGAKAHNIELEVLNATLKNYQKLQDQGHGNLGTQGLFKLFE